VKVINVTPSTRLVDERGFPTPAFLRMWGVLVTRTGGIGGDGGQDDFTLQSPAFGEEEALALELGNRPPEEPQPPDIPIVMQPTTSGEAWPIGSIFICATASNPFDLLGYGSWTAFGSGRVPVGLNAADPDFDTLEETGGSKTSAISAHAGAAVADHAEHTHTFTQSSNSATPDLVAVDTTGTGVAASGTSGGASATLTHVVTQPSDHSAVSVVQPYIVVQMWKRTA
jgi:hypothetical protein